MANILADAMGSFGEGIGGGINNFYAAQEQQRQREYQDRERLYQEQERKRQLAAHERELAKSRLDAAGKLARLLYTQDPSRAAGVISGASDDYKSVTGQDLLSELNPHGLGNFRAPTYNPTVNKTVGGEGNPAGLDYSPIKWSNGGAVPASMKPDYGSPVEDYSKVPGLANLFSPAPKPDLEALDPFKNYRHWDQSTGSWVTDQTGRPNTMKGIRIINGVAVDLSDPENPRQVFVGPESYTTVPGLPVAIGTRTGTVKNLNIKVPQAVTYKVNDAGEIVAMPEKLVPGGTVKPVKTGVMAQKKQWEIPDSQKISPALKKQAEIELQSVIDEQGGDQAQINMDLAWKAAVVRARRKLGMIQVEDRGAKAHGEVRKDKAAELSKLMTDSQIKVNALAEATRVTPKLEKKDAYGKPTYSEDAAAIDRNRIIIEERLKADRKKKIDEINGAPKKPSAMDLVREVLK